ncbi:MAG: ATP-binding protein, partial [Chloroflexota bacterium]|nr:ATP-binding protein [Chloroflexota bacterium]
MARADQLKRLFTGYEQRDDKAFLAVAQEIIEDERRKHHTSVAKDLASILSKPTGAGSTMLDLVSCEPAPLDPDRKTPLLEIRQPDRYLDNLILSSDLRNVLWRAIEEFLGWEVLAANGLKPMRNILFCGPPGCGKTVAAEAMAAELSLPL